MGLRGANVDGYPAGLGKAGGEAITKVFCEIRLTLDAL